MGKLLPFLRPEDRVALEPEVPPGEAILIQPFLEYVNDEVPMATEAELMEIMAAIASEGGLKGEV